MAKNLIIPEGYEPVLNLRETERAITYVKDFFQPNLAEALNLERVSSPLFVKSKTGINDDLNGIEKPCSFKAEGPHGYELEAELVQSCAKWKRMKLAEYNFSEGEGLYADMNATRPDDNISNFHSLYVDQWDWEKVISKEKRNLKELKFTVKRIYNLLRRLENYVYEKYLIKPILPENITFIHTLELEKKYPNLSPKERENKACEEHGAIFMLGVGCDLKSGEPHDGRAPDYDDWTTESEEGYPGLNGDIMLWNPLFKESFEISSMGIRVDKESLMKQLKIRNCMDRKDLWWHQQVLNDKFPLTMGGGIGQSRICMFFLRKAHIGEVQCGLWPDEIVKECEKNNIQLL